MPAGVGMGEYMRFMAAAMFSMFLGGQTVHLLYRPLDDMDDYVKKAKEEKDKEKQDVWKNTEASAVERLLRSPRAGHRD